MCLHGQDGGRDGADRGQPKRRVLGDGLHDLEKHFFGLSLSPSSIKRQSLPPRRSTRGDETGVWLPSCHVAHWSTSIGTAAVVVRACVAPIASVLTALPSFQSLPCGHGPETADNSSPQGIEASYRAWSGSMGASQTSSSSQISE